MVLDVICNGLVLQGLPFFYNVYLSPTSIPIWQHPRLVPSIPNRFVSSFFLLVLVVDVVVVVLEAFFLTVLKNCFLFIASGMIPSVLVRFSGNFTFLFVFFVLLVLLYPFPQPGGTREISGSHSPSSGILETFYDFVEIIDFMLLSRRATCFGSDDGFYVLAKFEQ